MTFPFRQDGDPDMPGVNEGEGVLRNSCGVLAVMNRLKATVLGRGYAPAMEAKLLPAWQPPPAISWALQVPCEYRDGGDKLLFPNAKSTNNKSFEGKQTKASSVMLARALES